MFLVCVELGEIPLLCKTKQANLTDHFIFYQYCIYKAVVSKIVAQVCIYGFDDVSEKDVHGLQNSVMVFVLKGLSGSKQLAPPPNVTRFFFREKVTTQSLIPRNQ